MRHPVGKQAVTYFVADGDAFQNITSLGKRTSLGGQAATPSVFENVGTLRGPALRIPGDGSQHLLTDDIVKIDPDNNDTAFPRYRHPSGASAAHWFSWWVYCISVSVTDSRCEIAGIRELSGNDTGIAHLANDNPAHEFRFVGDLGANDLALQENNFWSSGGGDICCVLAVMEAVQNSYTAAYLYRNGAQVASQLTTSTDLGFRSYDTIWAGAQGTTDLSQWDILGFGTFSGPVNPAAAKAFTLNPWSILEAPRVWVPVPSAAAGFPVPLLQRERPVNTLLRM